MSPTFSVKSLLSLPESESFCLNFGFKSSPTQLQAAINDAFFDYIVLALSEEKESRQLRDQHYQEALYYLDKAKKLLQGQAHPAGSMANKLDKMVATLQKVMANQSDIAEDRAKRFVELNLVRKLRNVWQVNTNTPFYAGIDGSERSPHDFLYLCFRAASREYPEISWFAAVNDRAIDYMIRAVRR